MVGNKSNKHVSNFVFILLVLKFFNIHTRESKAISFKEIIW